jgi:hypothetical protein
VNDDDVEFIDIDHLGGKPATRVELEDVMIGGLGQRGNIAQDSVGVRRPIIT